MHLPAKPAHRRWPRVALAGLLAVLAGPVLLAVALVVFGANWARAPLAWWVQQHTGRVLQIAGDLRLRPGWPLLQVQVQGLRFANPAWAREPQMAEVDRADLQLDLRALLAGRLVLPTVDVGRPVVMLETAADGRRSWLLDLAQSDDDSAVQIGKLTLQQGRIGYDDAQQQTHLRLAVDTAGARSDPPGHSATSTTSAASELGGPTDVLFTATGLLRGQPVQASGRGASVLGLRDENPPYPLMLAGRIGPTHLQADGRISALSRLGAVDLQVAARGDSLAQLFPLLGVGLPPTAPYATAGRVRRHGRTWHYQGFSGRVGRSDVAGNLAVVLGGPRPLLRGDVQSRLLDLGDLAPVVGLQPAPPADAPVAASAPAAARGSARRLLPDLPFSTDRWRLFDADLQLQARHLLHATAVPLDHASARLRLQDAVLTLEGLDIGVAGGQVTGQLAMDARGDTVQASTRLQARGVQLAALMVLSDTARASFGRIHGRFDLQGQGNSVGRLLASADGALQLAVDPGRISRLLMERMGLHVLEVLQLSLTGDRSVALRCAVADFSLKSGVMTARHLALDTAVSSVAGTGHIDLNREQLDLTLVPHSRRTSLVALRGPIRLHGPLAAPQVQLDTAGILARGAGAVALGLVNPLLALLPLVEPGQDRPSHCNQVVAQAGLNVPAAAASAPDPRAAPAAPRNGTPAGTAPPAPPPSRP